MTWLRFLVTTTLALALMPATDAWSASYTVSACDHAPNGRNRAWTYVGTTGDHFDAADRCEIHDNASMYVRESLGAESNVPEGSTAYWSFDAPATTTLSAISYSRHLRTYSDAGWRAELLADGTAVEQCMVPSVGEACDRGEPGGDLAYFPGLSAERLRFGVRCAPSAPSTSCVHGGTLHRVTAVLYGATVTVNDPKAPAVTGGVTGTLVGGGWVRGVKSAGMSGSDETGIKELALVRDGDVMHTTPFACDYTFAAPCALGTRSASWASVDTSAWSDGEHEVRGRAVDAAGNVTQTPAITVRTDNAAPGSPLGLDTGPRWSRDRVRTVSWLLPGGQAAPVTDATVRICRVSGGECVVGDADSTTLDELTLPSDGEWELSVWLRDAAGNEDPARRAETIVGVDRVAPAAPTLGRAVLSPDGSEFVVPMQWSDSGPAPARIVAERCDANGGACEPVAGTTTDEIRTAAPGEGTWILRARAIDDAGNSSDVREVALARVLPDPGITPLPRKVPDLAISRTRFKGSRLSIRGRAPARAMGAITLRVKAKGRRAVSRTLRPGPATFRVRVKVPRRARRVRLTLSFVGDAIYLPAVVRRTARRR